MHIVDIALIQEVLNISAPYEEHDIHPRIKKVTVILEIGRHVKIIEEREAVWHNPDGN